MSDRELVFRVHAIRRMFERRIAEEEVRFVVEKGQVIESYPDDQPYPSRLILGFPGGRPLHIVAADVSGAAQTVIITVYDPDPEKWADNFSWRR